MSEHDHTPKTYEAAIAEGFTPIEDFAAFLDQRLGITENQFEATRHNFAAAVGLCDCATTPGACLCADYCSPNGVRILRYCGPNGVCNGQAAYGKCQPYG